MGHSCVCSGDGAALACIPDGRAGVAIADIVLGAKARAAIEDGLAAIGQQCSGWSALLKYSHISAGHVSILIKYLYIPSKCLYKVIQRALNPDQKKASERTTRPLLVYNNKSSRDPFDRGPHFCF